MPVICRHSGGAASRSGSPGRSVQTTPSRPEGGARGGGGGGGGEDGEREEEEEEELKGRKRMGEEEVEVEEDGEEEVEGAGGGAIWRFGLSASIVGGLRRICMRCHGDFTQLNLYSSLCGGAERRRGGGGGVQALREGGREEEWRLDETEHL